jgi:hypothetical protein
MERGKERGTEGKKARLKFSSYFLNNPPAYSVDQAKDSGKTIWFFLYILSTRHRIKHCISVFLCFIWQFSLDQYSYPFFTKEEIQTQNLNNFSNLIFTFWVRWLSWDSKATLFNTKATHFLLSVLHTDEITGFPLKITTVMQMGHENAVSLFNFL